MSMKQLWKKRHGTAWKPFCLSMTALVFGMIGVGGVTLETRAADYVITDIEAAPEKCEDKKLTSAVWHDVALEYQGGNQYGVLAIWDTTSYDISGLTFTSEDSYVLPIPEQVDDVSEVVIWEYEKKSYESSARETIEYYERVKKADAPVVTAYVDDEEGDGGTIAVKNLNPEHPIAILVTTRQGMLEETQEDLDAYWHYYYTDGYAASHDNFLLEYYNYEKTQETVDGESVNVLTLSSFVNDGLCNYSSAAIALGISALAEQVSDSRYGKSPVPEGLSNEDFKIENWKIPAVYTDSYDGLTYQVRLAENIAYYEDGTAYAKSRPLFPINAVNVEVDSGVIFPEDCRYLFYEPTGFSIQGDKSGVHSWVGYEWNTNIPMPDDYHLNTFGLTETFRITGGKMADNVKNMSYMFRFCSPSWGLKEFDISNINTANVTDMSNMFNLRIYNGSSMVGISSLDTKNVTNMEHMFAIDVYQTNQGKLEMIGEDLAGFDTKNVTNMERMFADCDITSLDLSVFDFSSVTTMKEMFYRDFILQELVLPESAGTDKVEDMSGMFRGCAALAKIDNLKGLNTGNVTTMADMFGGYYFHYGKPYAPWDYTGPSVTSIDLSGFDTGKVTDMSGMFDLPNVTMLDISSFDTASVTNMSRMFDLDSATKLDISKLKTSNVTDMSKMFTLASATELDVSSLDTSKVANMSGMFTLDSVTALDVSAFNTSNVTNMGSMFTLEKATKLILGDDFATGSVTNMYNMFCLASIRKFEVSLDASASAGMDSIFNMASCTELKAGIKGNSGTTSTGFSINAPNLVTLDLSGSDINLMKQLYTSSSYSGTFINCTSLVDLYLPAVMPDTWNSYDFPVLPVEFYLVGAEEDDENFSAITDFTNIAGDLSQYAVVKGSDTISDSKSDRPILSIDNAILLRAVSITPVKGVSINTRKYNMDTGENEYEDIEEITLYRYDGVKDTYSSSILDGYPNYADICAVTDPDKTYPLPNLTWTVREERDSEDSPVFTEYVDSSNKYYSIYAYEGIGTAEITLTAEGMDAGNGTTPENYKDKVKVTVLPMVRADKIAFPSYQITMKPGETKENAAAVTNSNEIHANDELTFPGATYESSDPDIVEVDVETGTLTAKGLGEVKITATSVDPKAITTYCYVNVTETGEIEQNDTINWLYLGVDSTLTAQWTEGVVACIGTTSTLDEMKQKETIRYDKTADTIVLTGYDELNLCIFKQDVNVLLQGENKIHGYHTPAVDGFCIDADCTMRAEAGATLTVSKTAFEEHDGFVCTLDASVTKTEQTDGTILFAGSKTEEETPGDGDNKGGTSGGSGDGGSGTSGGSGDGGSGTSGSSGDGGNGAGGTTSGATTGNSGDNGQGGTTGGNSNNGGNTDNSNSGNKTPAVGTTEKNTSGTATYKVTDTSTDSSGSTVVEVAYVAPTTSEKKKTTITVPDTVTLADGTVAEVTEIVANAFKNNKKVTKVTVGKNVEKIGAAAFSGCTKLKTVNVGSKVKSIGNNAFAKCTSLTRITIPETVVSIGKTAFNGDKKLKTITIKSKKLTSKTVSKNAFKGISTKTTIKVPKAKKKAYTTFFRKKGLSKNVKIK